MSRYTERRIFTNREPQTEELRKMRNVSKIDHYETPVFPRLTKEDYGELKEVGHTWTTGDRFYKLSHQYYGTTKYWWVIARYNKTPTEAHVRLGRKIFIPLPLNRILNIFGV